MLIVIPSIFSGTLILAISWKHCSLNSCALFSSEVSFGTFLCLAFAIVHDSHTGNIPFKLFIPSWCAVFLVVSSLRCPKYSWACLTLILKIFFASSFRLSRLELSNTTDATSKLSGSCVSYLLKIAQYSAPPLVLIIFSNMNSRAPFFSFMHFLFPLNRYSFFSILVTLNRLKLKLSLTCMSLSSALIYF